MEIKGWGKPPQNVKTNNSLDIIKTRLRKLELQLNRLERLLKNELSRYPFKSKSEEVKRECDTLTRLNDRIGNFSKEG